MLLLFLNQRSSELLPTLPLGTHSTFSTYFKNHGSNQIARFTFRDRNHKQIKLLSQVT